MVSLGRACRDSFDGRHETQLNTIFKVNGSCGRPPDKNDSSSSNSGAWSEDAPPKRLGAPTPASALNILRLPPPTPRGPVDASSLTPPRSHSPAARASAAASRRLASPQRPWAAPQWPGHADHTDVFSGVDLQLASPRSPSGPSTAATSATPWSSGRSVECCSPPGQWQGKGSPIRRAESQTTAGLEARLDSLERRLGRDSSISTWRIAETRFDTRLGQLERKHGHAKAELDAQLSVLRAARAHVVAGAKTTSASGPSTQRRAADAPRRSPRRPPDEELC